MMLTNSKNYTKFTGKENSDLKDAIEALRQQKWTLGFAESCTGGRLSATWAEVPGVSEVFMGSVVSYSNQVKVDLLGVSQESLQKEGAVSSQVALQMAQGLRQRLRVDWALAITGIAGPGGGSPHKPVGTVHFAVLGPGVEETSQQLFSGERVEIQEASVEFATAWLKEWLLKKQK